MKKKRQWKRSYINWFLKGKKKQKQTIIRDSIKDSVAVRFARRLLAVGYASNKDANDEALVIYSYV